MATAAVGCHPAPASGASRKWTLPPKRLESRRRCCTSTSRTVTSATRPPIARPSLSHLERLQPNWVFLPWLGDSHLDHSRIAQASSEVLRHSQVEQLLYYETWTPVEATHVVDITTTLETKKASLLCHETALKYGNYLDAMLGLNAYRALYLAPDQRRWAEAFAVTPPRPNRFL